MDLSPIPRFLGQPEALPPSLLLALAEAAPGEQVRAFAYCDLDARLRFAAHWAVLLETRLAVAEPAPAGTAGPPWVVRAYLLAEIEKFESLEGLTCTWLHLLGPERRLLETLHYTRRQNRALGNLVFVAEQTRDRLLKKDGPPALASGFDPALEYREAVLKAVRDAQATIAKPQMSTVMRLLAYLRPHRTAVLAAFLMAAASTLLYLLPPYLTRLLVDNVLRPVGDGGVADPKRLLWLIIGGLAAIWILGEVFSFFRLRIMSIAGEKVAMYLREDLYRHLQRQSLSFFSARPTGSLVARVSSDTDRLWDFVVFGVIDIILAVLQIFGVATALLLQDWFLGLLVLIPVPLMMLMFYVHGRQLHGLFLRIWRKWSAMTTVLSDVIPGIRVVKAFAREEYEVDRFIAKNRAVELEAEALHRNWTRFWPCVTMLMHSCTLIIWIVGAPRVIQHFQSGGKEGMPLGVFLAFMGYMWMFWEPVRNLGMMSRTFNRVMSSASRVFEVLDTVPGIVNRPNAKVVPQFEGQIVFDRVSFSYDGVRNVLKNVSFAVKPGEMIGLVGPSGSGKTTLVNLICRFYDVKDGAIRIDGHDVRDLELTCLRRQIGIVLQEPYLFHGTIAENIAYGHPGATLAQIVAAAKAANAHDFVCGLPDGYETLVGERGQTLSGGERQRVSIARAILHNPRILILDEATSSVDTETEKRIQEALQRLVAGRSTFAIAHRLSTLSAAHRLFVMEDGKLVEQGTHAELLAKPDGLYAKLHRTQLELQANIAV